MSAEIVDLADLTTARLIGREDELEQIVDLLIDDADPGSDLLTLCGAAGIGKTSAAIEAADRLETSGRATAFVRLESAVTTSDLLLAVAAAVALPAGEEGSLLDRLADLGTTQRWVVLDNCEHLRGHPHPVAVLRQACPGFRLLATSIRPLRIAGERTITLSPLALPAAEAASQEIRASPAVQLYLQRAVESSAAFTPTVAQLPDIAAVCRQVDGLPLGIELLAARVTTMPPASAQHYLQAHPAIGLEQPRTAPAVSHRHRSLHAALEWTHALVPADAATLLRRMAVFTGPVGLEQLGVLHTWGGGETSGQRDSELLDLVADLVDVRLVEPRAIHHEPTFALLPLVRDFALAQLDAHGERDLVEERRVDACLALTRSRKRDLDLGSDSDAMIELSARETDLRQVLERLVAADDVERGLELGCGITPLVFRRGYDGFVANALQRLLAQHDRGRPRAAVPEALVVEARLRLAQIHLLTERPADLDPVRSLLREAAAQAADLTDVDVRLLAHALTIRTLPITADFAGAADAVVRGLALAEEEGDDRMVARFSGWAGMVRNRLGDAEGATACARRSLDAALASDDAPALIIVWLCLQGIPDDLARPMLARLPALPDLLATARRIHDRRSESLLLRTAAAAAVVHGDPVTAARLAADCLRVGGRSLQSDALNSMTAVIVEVAAARGDHETAVRLDGTLADHRDLLVGSAPQAWIERYDATVAEARAALDEQTAARAFEDGRATPLAARPAIVRDYADLVARSDTDGADTGRVGAAVPAVPGAQESPLERLTPREQQVLQRIATGATNKQIAEQLGMTAKTVMHHSGAIYRKLGVRGRAEATAWAFRAGQVD